MPHLRLREQGEPIVLQRDIFEAHWRDILLQLQQHRVLRVRLSPTHVLVYPNQYAGIARSSAGTIRVDARYPAVLDVLRWTRASFAREVPLDVYNPTGEERTGRDEVSAFLDATAEVSYGGLPFSYTRETITTSSPTGTLDFGRTVSELSTRGIHHLAVVRRPIAVSDVNLLTVLHSVGTLLEEAELLAATDIDRLGLHLGSDLQHRLAVPASEALLASARVTDTWGDRPDILRLCTIADTILQRLILPMDVEYLSGPVSFRFVDTNAIWERAIHSALESDYAAAGDLETVLHPYSATKMPLFPDGGPDIDPDIVLFQDTTAVAVVDAKNYVASSADADSVYQVWSYARRMGVGVASLWYLSESPWETAFGDAETTILAFGCAKGTQTSLLDSMLTAAARLREESVT